MPATVSVSVPGGFALEDGWRRTLRLRPLTGWDEVEVLGGRREPPAALATRLLARCVFLDEGGDPAGPDFVRALTVGDREALLLQLRAWSVGEVLPCVLTCPGCGEKMEMELHTGSLLLDPYPHEGVAHSLTVAASGGAELELVFRLPNGGDQEAVAPSAAADPAKAAQAIAGRCVLSMRGGPGPGDGLTPQAVATLSGRMADLDPQAEIRLRLTCPDCAEDFETVFDSLQYLKAEMERTRARLDEEVHLLAYHYHWSEGDILGMPGARRHRYAEHLRNALQPRGAS